MLGQKPPRFAQSNGTVLKREQILFIHLFVFCSSITFNWLPTINFSVVTTVHTT